MPYVVFFSGKVRLLIVLSLVYMSVRILLDYHKQSLHEQLRVELNAALPKTTQFTSGQHLRGFLNGFEQEGSKDIIHVVPSVAVGERVPNCGLPAPCGSDSFSAHLFTGIDHHDQPKVCVDGKYVLGDGLNNGGRGINMVVLDTVSKHLQQVIRFDTYQEDSSLLESLLLNLRAGDIVLLVTFDEPTKKLSSVARLLFHELGSALSQNLLHYRSSWYLVTQKGIDGFTPYEDLHTVLSKGWPPPHNVRLCIPFKIEGMPVHPDPSQHDNTDRAAFCHRHANVLPTFCTGDSKPAQHIFQPKVPENKLSSSPIIVVSGPQSRFLPQTLDTLALQSGLVRENVLVFHETDDLKAQDLCELFNFSCQLLQSDLSGGHCELLGQAMDTTETIYPDAPYMTIIEPDVLLGSDFLSYASAMASLLDVDSTIGSVSGFNPDGSNLLSKDPSQAYRIQGIPGTAFVVRRGGFSARERCAGEQWDSVVPEVSRALAISDDALQKHNVYLGSPLSWSAAPHLEKALYDQWLSTNIRQSILATLDPQDCIFEGLSYENLPPSQIIATIFEQSFPSDESALNQLARRCFQIDQIQAGYRGLHRLHFKDHPLFLIGSKSPFAKVS
ncbi:protein O-linked-mannose beta-1,2-N-acetylglucosaminyltransferase 1-like isoform X2 [Varroa destructor]|uniref:ILEI/PANDER domain-containing protein n=1 Tax=Varroa destructor TaxID=109461 RepID=A0A7M7JCM1_VARDE|nr:protein O-linked-mannose beta-1,2-N-acetylglucosaminyltransferase 1-like isoform X2 [Varroa destructor]